ncbi:Glycoside hydrolase [Macleaya cordata]|uniref:Glycoside hydrolase n=1 Tax=Macleaya cordata TaxID=56857 RepID=A0A200QWW4_MACCD|nr:Glycoside hydrolase [Macleaya cordata]
MALVGLVSRSSNISLLPAATVFFIIIPFLTLMINADKMIANNVADFGAKGDGKSDASRAFLRAWAASCNSMEPSTVYVPHKNKYLLNQTVFQGPCKNSRLTFRIDGTLIAPDYKKMGSSVENWLMFDMVQGLSIIGGLLDGKGSSLYAYKATKQGCPKGPTSLAFFSSKNIQVQNLTSINAKLFHIIVNKCQNVILQGIKIRAPQDSPNTEGIHIQNSLNVRVLNTSIKTGDDCISIGPDIQNLWVQRIACGPGHGISIENLGKDHEEEGVQNVMVKNVVFTGTQNGLRIISWRRPSNGFVRGVVFKQVVMNNVQNPILIDQNYCPPSNEEGCLIGQNSGIQISRVTFANIKGTSTTQVAMKFDCSKTSPCNGINVENIMLTYRQQHQQLAAAKSFCQNAHGFARGSVLPPSCL